MHLNGIAKKKGFTEKDVSSETLKQGIDVELEHTKDEATAKKIALDHLSEDVNYYKKLKLVEGKNMKFEDILEKKGKKLDGGPYREARMHSLKELLKVMGDEMGGHLGDLKKVTVASSDKEGLEKGLDKAKEVVGEMPENSEENSEEKEDELMEKAAEGASPEMPEPEEMEEESEDEEEEEPKDVAGKIAMLEQQLAELKKHFR